MSKTEFVLNPDGVRALLQSPEMHGVLSSLAAPRAARAGDGYAAAVHVGKKRCYANIYPDSDKAYRDNNEHNTLLKVLG